METSAKTVWLVDDDADDADAYERLFEEAGLTNIEVRPPEPVFGDYAALASQPETGAFVIDYHLSDKAGVPYSGLDAADYLRSLQPELPVFILTNFSTESGLEEHAGSVEAVIPKENVQRHAWVYASRILRSMERYEMALTRRQRRIQQLIDKKLSEEINAEEENELTSLRADTERAFDLALSSQETTRNEQLRRDEERLAQLRVIAKELAQLNDGPQTPQ